MRKNLWVVPVAMSFVFVNGLASAQVLTTLAAFTNITGRYPEGALIADSDSNLYGTASDGGANNNGTIFKFVGASSTLTALASFNINNGWSPHGGLITDNAGNYFGTTQFGGATGRGNIFKFDGPTSSLSTLASFNGANGLYPYSSLIRDAEGNLYGTASGGGANNVGTIFKLVPGANSPITLVSFNGLNGANPYAGLIADAAGNFYGVTNRGGQYDLGTVFKLAAGTNALTTIVSLGGGLGSHPYGNLTMDNAGNIYGITSGETSFSGTVFKIAAGSNTATLLKQFHGWDGANPMGGILCDVAGNVYGTTSAGGTNTNGTVFKIAAGTNTFATLSTFRGPTNGSRPYGNMIVDGVGNLYGTTREGGPFNYGTVFKLAGAGYVSLIGDTNADNIVDFNDLLALAQAYGTTSGALWTNGDFTRDGAVSFDDLLILAQNFAGANLNTQSAFFNVDSAFIEDWRTALSLVPEPQAALVIAAATPAAARRTRQRRLESKQLLV